MINYDSKKGMCMIEGTLMNLVIDTLTMLKVIYNQISSEDPALGEMYKKHMDMMYKYAFISDEELHKRSEEARSQTKDMINNLEGMMNTLKNILNQDGVDTSDLDKADDDFQAEFEKFLHGEDEE